MTITLLALLVKELKEAPLPEKWVYHQNDADAPCDDAEAVEKYDSLFTPKVRPGKQVRRNSSYTAIRL